ncbi:MAG: hypothetical protein IT384_13070 [Deltaproteobacteria bacterium]|nr:hypothetical protein [Deltaproteobacteria bacterium]
MQRARTERSSLLGFDLVELEARSAGSRTWYEIDRWRSRHHRSRSGWSDGLLYLHGFASGPGSFKARRFAEAMARLGFDLAIPDLNAGDFAHLTLSRSIELAQRKLRDRTVVIGSSFGGYTATVDRAIAATQRMIAALGLSPPAAIDPAGATS